MKVAGHGQRLSALRMPTYTARTIRKTANVRVRAFAGSRSATCFPASEPSIAVAAKGTMVRPVEALLAGAGRERGGGVDGDDEQRRADGVLHRVAQSDDQCRDDHEAAADAEEAGQEPDEQARDDDLDRVLPGGSRARDVGGGWRGRSPRAWMGMVNWLINS